MCRCVERTHFTLAPLFPADPSEEENEPLPENPPTEQKELRRRRRRLQDDFDSFLDTPFFDPDQVINDPNSPPLLKRIATFVRDDYSTAELIASGALLVLLIIVSQEMLRIQMYGLQNYVPFSKGVLPGDLF